MVSDQRETKELVDHFFRQEYARLTALLTNRYGTAQIEKIEDALQEAFIQAMNTWSFREVPRNPGAWIFRVANHKLIDQLRKTSRSTNLEKGSSSISLYETGEDLQEEIYLEHQIQDDQLRMAFACCHPEVPRESQVMLVLKLLCGFGNREIGRALLKNEEAVAKALTRAKKRFREKVNRLEIPEGKDLMNRLDIVLQIIYLLFNEGYNSTQGQQLLNADLCYEALRLGKVLEKHPHCNTPELHALIALMCFQASRNEARISAGGSLITLEKQDRSNWDHKLIRQGIAHFNKAISKKHISEYHLQASIAFHHCVARTFEDTDWSSIIQLYDILMQVKPTPVAALHRIVALSRTAGPHTALEELYMIENDPLLQSYHLLYAIKGDLLLATGNYAGAIHNFDQAIKLTANELEKRFLDDKLKIAKNPSHTS